MRCWPSVETETCAPRPRPWRLLAALLGIAWAAVSPASQAGFQVLEASSQLEDGVHRVNARVDFAFSREAIEAMQKGVAVTVSVRMQVRRERALIDETIAEVRASYRIQAHSLSRRFLVVNLSTDESMTFQTYDAMKHGLGTIRNFPLLDDGVLKDGERYQVRVRATLDIESLPAPMRPLAYLSSSWRLSSDWTSWPLQR